MPWLLTLPLVLVFCLVTYTILAQQYKRWVYRHIPGPTPWPLLGNLMQLIKLGSPAATLAWSKQYGPVFKIFLASRMFVVVADPEMMRRVFTVTNHAPFASASTRLLVGEPKTLEADGLLQARDAFWKFVRGAWMPAFAKSSLEGYMPMMDKSAGLLVQSLDPHAAPAGGPALPAVDMHRWYGKLTLQVVGSTAFGVNFNMLDRAAVADGRDEEGTELVEACQEWFRGARFSETTHWQYPMILAPYLTPVIARLSNMFPDARLKKSVKIRMTIINYSRSLIAKWRQEHGAFCLATSPTTNGSSKLADAPEATDRTPSLSKVPGVAPGSFMGLMLAARHRTTGESLTDGQITAQAAMFLIAGYETTANALAFCTYLLALHPEAEAKLVAEVDALGPGPLTTEDLAKLPYTDACVQEALRLYAPAHATSRDADEDMVIGGYKVPKGTMFLCSINSVHLNDKAWPCVDEFRPERFLEDAAPELAARIAGAHVPFGGGTRMCPGSKFAMMEAKATLARLYQRYTFKLEPGQVPLKTTAGITLAPAAGVRVHVFAR